MEKGGLPYRTTVLYNSDALLFSLIYIRSFRLHYKHTILNIPIKNLKESEGKNSMMMIVDKC